VFREGAHLERVVAEVLSHVTTLGVPTELILVDDGSNDDTWRTIADLSRRHPELCGLRLSRNFGKESAVSAGLDEARGRAVVVMDGDLQHPPELIPKMFALWNDGAVDLIEAMKEGRPSERFVNRIGSHLFYFILNRFAGHDLKNASDFKLMDRRVVDAWRRMGERNLFFRGMIAWLGFERARVTFSVPPRAGGRSGWTTLQLVRLASTAVTAFSTSPLQIVTFLGGVFLLFAAGLGAQTLYNKIAGAAVSGFTTVILLLLIVGSAIMLSLGIIGAYIARIYEEVKGRPRYVVREKIR
jgi:glycosyltransferase involved in cell wall biosynthesis